MLKKRFYLLVLIATVGFWVVSCSDNPVASGETSAENATPTLSATGSTNAESSGPELIPVDGPGVLEAVEKSEGRAVLVNIWATWCTPCVKKFPKVMALREKFGDAGLDVLFVSADFDDQTDEAREFLGSQGVDFATFIKTGKDQEFIETFESEWTGALPVMFLYDADGNLLHTWGEAVGHEEVEKTIEELLSANS